MWKYRYRRDYFTDDALVAGCNALGDAGWNLVGLPRWCPPMFERDGVQYPLGAWQCFFKRTVSNREQLTDVFRLNSVAEPQL